MTNVPTPGRATTDSDGSLDQEPWWRRLDWLGVCLLVFVLAFLVRLIPVLQGGGIGGFYNYDPAVYFAGSVGLAHGLMPYRDFLMLHPPGVMVGLLPYAELSRVIGESAAMKAARLTTMALGATTAALVSLSLRRLGKIAMLVGGLAYAAYWPAVYSERATWLEGYGSFLTVAAMALVLSAPAQGDATRRGWVRWALVGALLALACSVKIWSVVALLPVLGFLWFSRGLRTALIAGAGAAAAGLAMLLPFLVALPQMWQMVVSDQLGRARGASDTLFMRLDGLSGLNVEWSGSVTPQAWLALAVIALLTAASLWSATGRFAGLVSGATLLLLLTAPTWFRHYPGLIAGSLCLGLGAGVSVVVHLLRARWQQLVAAVIPLALILTSGGFQLTEQVGTRFDGHKLKVLATEHPGCVTTDDPNSLIASNLLGANIQRGCPFVVDLSGYRYHLGGRETFLKNEAWQAFVRDYLGQGSLVILLRGTSKARYTPETASIVFGWPVVGTVSERKVRQPD